MAQRWLKALLLGREDRRQQRHQQSRPRRLNYYFDCTWQSPWGEERARVSSLSVTGCYIESRLTVPDTGTVVHDLMIALPTGTLSVTGKVVDSMRGIGFALHFTELDTNTRDRVSALVQAH